MGVLSGTLRPMAFKNVKKPLFSAVFMRFLWDGCELIWLLSVRLFLVARINRPVETTRVGAGRIAHLKYSDAKALVVISRGCVVSLFRPTRSDHGVGLHRVAGAGNSRKPHYKVFTRDRRPINHVGCSAVAGSDRHAYRY